MTSPIPQGKRLLCGNCHKALPLHFTYDYCPFCGTKIDGGIDCRKGEEKR
jgi:predicted amidophosphoribosyltransferase